jgi:hypothetical protein
VKLEAFAAGLGAGILVGALTRIVETSRIAFGPYALYGNGALAVPVILAPIAIFAGWSWLTRRTGWLSLESFVYVVGVVLGSGMGYAAAQQDISSALGATLGIGLFVVPAAVLAAITGTLLRARRLTSTPALVTAFIVGVLIAAVPPFAYIGGLGINGISAGTGVIATQGARPRAVLAVGLALAALVLVQAFALPLLIGPAFSPR